MSDNMGSTVVLLGAVAIGGYFLLKYLPSIIGDTAKGGAQTVTQLPYEVASGAVSGISSGLTNLASTVATAQGYTPSQAAVLGSTAVKLASNPIGFITGAYNQPSQPSHPAVHVDTAGKIVGASTSVNPLYKTGLVPQKKYGMGR